MTTKEKGGKPGWVTKRRTMCFAEKHARQLDELVVKAQETNHRANMTSVMEDAIEALYNARATEKV